MHVIAWVLVALVGVALVAYLLWARHREALRWNSGISSLTGEKWQLVDDQSLDGSRLYRAGTDEVWFSYGVDDHQGNVNHYPL